MKGYNEAGNYRATVEIFLEFSSNRAATLPMMEEVIVAASQSGKHLYVLKLFDDQVTRSPNSLDLWGEVVLILFRTS